MAKKAKTVSKNTAVKKATAKKVKDEVKEEKKKKAKTEGFTILNGIPDSTYVTLPDVNFHAMLSAMFGTKGIPEGKIIEVAGGSDAGKTALCQLLLGMIQGMGHKVAITDVERSTTPQFASLCGINPKTVMFSQPTNGEDAMKALRYCFENGAKAGLLDSTAACLPKAVAEDNANSMAALARLMSVEMPKVDKVVADANGVLFMISQVKTKPGVVFGNPEYVSGGSAPGYHSRIRMILRKIEEEKDKETKQAIRHVVRAKIHKNHCGPKRTVDFHLVVDHMFRVDITATAARWAQDFKLVNASKTEVLGYELEGGGTLEKKLMRALKGKEAEVFNAVNDYFVRFELGKDLDTQDTMSDEVDVIDEDFEDTNDTDFNHIDIPEEELDEASSL